MRGFVVDLTCRSLPYDIRLVDSLKNSGVEVDLWIAGCLPELQKKMSGRSVLDIASSAPEGMLRKALKGIEYLLNGIALHQSLRTAPPDVVHYQWLPFAEKMPALELSNLMWAKRSGAGVIYTIHNVLPHDTGDHYRDSFQRIYRIPDALICHTEESKIQLVRDFNIPPSKIWVIPHGHLSGEISFVPRERARSQLQIDPDVPLCLLFGHIRPYKGVEFLVESWQHVNRREPTARLMLAGQPNGQYDELLRDKIRKLELGGVIDTKFEFIPQDKLNLCIHAADVLVYPYRSITQSGALMTGLTTGKPVVATNIGGFYEMIQHEQTGILVEYGNKEQLANELIHLIRHPEKRQRLGRAAKEMVETAYSWNAIARKTIECYENVIRTL